MPQDRGNTGAHIADMIDSGFLVIFFC